MKSVFAWLVMALGFGRMLRGKVKQELTNLDQLLEALERNDYAEATHIFLSWGTVASVMSKLPPQAQPFVPMIVPAVMEGLDAAIPEEEIGKLLALAGVDYDGPKTTAPEPLADEVPGTVPYGIGTNGSEDGEDGEDDE